MVKMLLEHGAEVNRVDFHHERLFSMLPPT
jgi:hypothetical protein